MKIKVRPIAAVLSLVLVSLFLFDEVAFADEEGTLTVHKYSGVSIPSSPEGYELKEITNQPLPGVEFEIFYLPDVEYDSRIYRDLHKFLYSNSNNPDRLFPGSTGVSTPTELSKLSLRSGNYRNVRKTDKDGVAHWDELEGGVYYVKEVGRDELVVEETLPFLISIPMLREDGKPNYTVHTYPKNHTLAIQENAVDGGAIGLADDILWEIFVRIPSKPIKDLRVRTTLDSRLDFTPTIDSVKIIKDQSRDDRIEVLETLTEEDYTIDEEKGTLTLTLSPEGVLKVDNYQTNELLWEVSTYVDKVGDGVIKNKSQLLMDKPEGSWDADSVSSNTVSSNWANAEIHKADPDGEPMEGVTFQIFDSEKEASICLSDPEHEIRECKNAVLINNKGRFTTNEEGVASLKGLHVGVNDQDEKEYWLVETSHPEGYASPETATKVSIKTDAENHIKVKNAVIAEAPQSDQQSGEEIVEEEVESESGFFSGGKAIIIGIIIGVAAATGVFLYRRSQYEYVYEDEDEYDEEY